ncbi:hypothetical protein [Orgyia pseudotsugata single capsid nuclopolyhedrovirus]|nr:hypothetical protein [Orgyia pseudotsugata single capsid nuclopolyhedrovirus]
MLINIFDAVLLNLKQKHSNQQHARQLERILTQERDAKICIKLMSAQLDQPALDAVAGIIKRIVWNFVKLMHITNRKLLAISLDKSEEFNEFVMRASKRVAHARFSACLKRIYEQYYLHDMQTIGWNELKCVLYDIDQSVSCESNK